MSAGHGRLDRVMILLDRVPGHQRSETPFDAVHVLARDAELGQPPAAPFPWLA